MGDREDKLTKAREKLDKFRKQKQQKSKSTAAPVVTVDLESEVKETPNDVIESSSGLASYFGQPNEGNSLPGDIFANVGNPTDDNIDDSVVVRQISNVDSDLIKSYLEETNNITADATPFSTISSVQQSDKYEEQQNEPFKDEEKDLKDLVQVDDAVVGTKTESIQQISGQISGLLSPNLTYMEPSYGLEVKELSNQLEAEKDEDSVVVRQISNVDSDLIKSCLEETNNITADAVPFLTISSVQQSEKSEKQQNKAFKDEEKDLKDLLEDDDTVVVTTTESLQILSSQISGLLSSNFTCVEPSYGWEVKELSNQLEFEKDGREKAIAMYQDMKLERDKLELRMKQEKNELEARVRDELGHVKSESATKTSTIELLVAEKSEIEKIKVEMELKVRELIDEQAGLTQTVEGLGAACAELRDQVDKDKCVGEELEMVKIQREEDMIRVKAELSEKNYECREIQSKLAQVTNVSDSARTELRKVKTELEMSEVHLQQLRSAGAHDTLFRDKAAEVVVLSAELDQTRKTLADMVDSRDHLSSERDQLAEQYRSYSRDLASQAERLAEQLRRYQEENAKMVHRETGLVQHVASLESQMQRFVAGGKNVTEEEICRLKERLVESQSDLRMARDEKEKLQEMFNERSSQVEDTIKRLAVSDNKVTELQAKISGLETTVEMLRSSSQSSSCSQADLLAACESDKVAASRAMQQNVELKFQLGELQGKVMSLSNSKAEIADQLENVRIKLNSLASVESEIEGLGAAVKEREVLIHNLRNQVKYLESELSKNVTPDVDKAPNMLKDELEDAREMIRGLNSHNSELRSQLEVLSSQSREGSQSRASGSGDSSISNSSLVDQTRTDFADLSSSTSESTDSFVELEDLKKAPSSDSFIDIAYELKTSEEYDYEEDVPTPVNEDVTIPVNEDVVIPVNEDVTIPVNSENLTIPISSEDVTFPVIEDVTIPVIEDVTIPVNDDVAIPVSEGDVTILENNDMMINNLEAMQQLEARFIGAMEQLAVMSSDKEQLEHMVERLQEETDTIGDYVIMYQHQRKQQKLKIQEKEDQVSQLACDRADLQQKLSQLQLMITHMVENKNNTTEQSNHEPAESTEHNKEENQNILKLLSEIGTDSSHLGVQYENFEPWFWANLTNKVQEM